MIYIKLSYIWESSVVDYEFVFNKAPQITEIIYALRNFKMLPLFKTIDKHGNVKFPTDIDQSNKLKKASILADLLESISTPIEYRYDFGSTVVLVENFELFYIDYAKIELGY